MKKIARFLFLLLTSLSALWLLSDTLLPSPLTYRAFRTVFMQYSGLIAIGAMSVAMLLAARPRWLETKLGGLDKMYRLHKWLGIVALVSAVLHWWWGQGTKWMTQWGWLVRPPRGARPNPQDLGSIEGWLRSQRGLAEVVGEWAFYLALVLLVLALVRRFPYHWFRKIHRWLAAIYLAFVFHAIVLAKIDYWGQPVGWALAVLLLAGSAAAVLVLAGRVGAGRRLSGIVEAVRHFPELRVVETRIALASGWPGHAAGQFAFVTFDRHEGAHPYTIASAWNAGDPSLSFMTKALGDYTGDLCRHLQAGMPVVVEGPYGCFDFEDERARQIWVGAGIGITPFIARMQQLARTPASRPIDLFYATRDGASSAATRLVALAQAAGVRLHVVDSGRTGRLDGARVRATVPEWHEASLWFCGPGGFARALREDLVGAGLPAAHFHHELFEMR